MKLDLIFKIDNLNNIIVKDTTIYEDENSKGDDLHNFRKKDSGSIFVLGYHTIKSDVEYIEPIFVNQHSDCSEYKIQTPKDGYVTLYHIVLPTKDYIDSFSNDEIKAVSYCYYIYDGNVFERKTNDRGERIDTQVCVKTLLEVNKSITTASINSKDYISIWNLQKCLVNLCRQIFDNIGANAKCFNINSLDKELIFKRDIVWMAINIIKYMTKYNMKNEAARIITQLEGCNGICTQTATTNVSGCGCNRQTQK